MKTSKSFGEFVLNVWAAIVRVVFPRYCVKCLTLKNRPNAVKYLLGKEKELEFINKLHLTDEDIAARVWSYATKLELIKRNCEALLAEVKTEEEFDAVVEVGNTRMLVKAARVYTPNRAKMKKLCASLAPITLKALAKEVPSVFDSLTAAEVLGAKEDEIIPTTYERWGVATILAQAKPSWAPVFLEKLQGISPNNLDEDGQALIMLFFNIAFEAKVDISAMMPYFCVIYPGLYAKVRDNIFFYKKVAPYFCIIFPQLLKYLRKDISYNSLYDVNLKGLLAPEQDVYVWLQIGYRRLDEPEIFSCVKANLMQIKMHLVPSLYRELFAAMVTKAPDYPALVVLYRIAKNSDDDVMKTEIPHKLVEGMENKMPGATLRFAFPFTGWNEKLAARAVEAMVVKKELPVERLGELSETLQQVAKMEMDVQSQLEVFRKGADADVNELVSKFILLPKAERFFFKQTQMTKQQVAYINHVKISDDCFRWLVLTYDIQPVRQEALVFAYVQKWKLTEEQYHLIQQSYLAQKAPFWSEYVVKK